MKDQDSDGDVVIFEYVYISIKALEYSEFSYLVQSTNEFILIHAF